MPASPFGEAWRDAALAEVAWRTPDGRADAAVVVPLTRGGRPVLALPYAQRRLAHQVVTSDTVMLALTHPTLARTTPRTAAVTGTLREDPEGETFLAGLLDQELAKHPPSRRRVDSPLLRREHWWYVPRLVIELTVTGPVESHAPGTALAAVAAEHGGLALTTLPGASDDLHGIELPNGPAVVLEHGARIPDLDPRWSHHRYGTVSGSSFRTTSQVTSGYPGRPPGLWRRWRDEAELARRCRTELAVARR